jgi:hypothetical protein
MRKIFLLFIGIIFILAMIVYILYSQKYKRYHIDNIYNIKNYEGVKNLYIKNQRIPRKIHQTFKKDMDVEYFETCMINRNMNFEYDYNFYDDNDIIKYIKKNYPQYLKAYNMLIPNAYKADLFRYLVLYKEGGIYMDCKSSTIFPLREFINSDIGFVSFQDRFNNGIQISFIASVPGHPILKKCIEISIDNILNKRYGISSLDITGPQVCGRAFNILLGRDELAEIEEKEYKEIDAEIIGTFYTIGNDNYQALCNKDLIPLISRTCGTYRKNKSDYCIRRILGLVYK